ncbi:MAG: putative RND superfamily exporter protein, partial [Bermanella sp.]
MLTTIDQFVVRLGRGILKYRWLTLLSTLVIVVMMASGARQLGFSTDYRVYFGPDNPQLRAFDEVQNIYNKNDITMVVIEPPGENAFNRDTLTLVDKFTSRAWELPYAIRVDSVTNFQHTQALGNDLKVADLAANPQNLSDAELETIRRIAIAEPLLSGWLTSPSGHVLAVAINHQYLGQSAAEVTEAVDATRQLRDELLKEFPGHAMYLSGSNMMSNTFAEASLADMQTLYPAMYGLLILVVFLFLRSITATIATVMIIIFSTAGAMGMAGYLGIALTSPSAVAPIVITTLAVADAVHILVSLFALMREGMNKNDAMVESLRLNFMPVFLTSITTALGLLSINFADSPPLGDLGNISAMGAILAWLLSIILLPALIAILPLRAPAQTRNMMAAKMKSLGEFIVRKPKPVFFASAAIALVLMALIPLNEANDKFVHYFDERIDFRNDSDFMADNITGLYTMEFSLPAENGVVDPEYLAKLEEFKGWWYQNPKVMHVSSISDIFKRLNKNLHGDDEEWYRLPEQRDLAAQYLLLYEFSLPFGLDLNNSINNDKSASRF